MDLLETKKKVLEGLRSRTVNVAVSFGDMKDENFKRYKFGEWTLYDFVNSVSDDTAYTLVETVNNNFLLIDRKIQLPPQTFLDPEKIKNLFSESSKAKLVVTFPELVDVIEKCYAEINSAGCTGCAKNSKMHMFIQEIMYLDNKERDLSRVEELFGTKFLETLKTFPKQARPGNRPQIPVPVPAQSQVQQLQSSSATSASSSSSPVVMRSSESSDPFKVLERVPSDPEGAGPRPSCVECCMKHIGTAIVLLEEAANGYPSHRWLAAGELNEAANETLRDFPEVAKEIREYRHLVVKDTKKVPNLMELLNKLDKKFFYNG